MAIEGQSVSNRQTITYGSLEGRLAVAIIGNGPSTLGWEQSDLPNGCQIARCNFFFLEQQMRFGSHVDYYFWGLNNPDLHDRLTGVISQSRYTFSRFFCPVPVHALTFRSPSGPWAALLDRRIYDPWKILSREPELGRFMMGRPMPTTGLQMLATLAVLGIREFHLIGLDFYEGSVRYAYDPPDDLVQSMDPKHFRPGYEAGAHSVNHDSSFLSIILEVFPDIGIRAYSPGRVITAVLERTRPIRVSFDNPTLESL